MKIISRKSYVVVSEGSDLDGLLTLTAYDKANVFDSLNVFFDGIAGKGYKKCKEFFTEHRREIEREKGSTIEYACQSGCFLFYKMKNRNSFELVIYNAKKNKAVKAGKIKGAEGRFAEILSELSVSRKPMKRRDLNGLELNDLIFIDCSSACGKLFILRFFGGTVDEQNYFAGSFGEVEIIEIASEGLVVGEITHLDLAEEIGQGVKTLGIGLEGSKLTFERGDWT